MMAKTATHNATIVRVALLLAWTVSASAALDVLSENLDRTPALDTD